MRDPFLVSPDRPFRGTFRKDCQQVDDRRESRDLQGDVLGQLLLEPGLYRPSQDNPAVFQRHSDQPESEPSLVIQPFFNRGDQFIYVLSARDQRSRQTGLPRKTTDWIRFRGRDHGMRLFASTVQCRITTRWDHTIAIECKFDSGTMTGLGNSGQELSGTSRPLEH